ncbi:RNA polymerase sigma factor [Ammoniphilus resinae]|uniref:RNA polymerase sigma-70 factor (ECF subfamily) n=1 Tax=Ammoniphilus resinae TaxID=861532 RepID=A0ABS4GN90_9BACL|nr:sigma-70 family RNA polymerase sigma factor [Ammoniphilus resinae]MBP1931739.1 RNA polymerase sigma-70 factor (ECF subfamily) [Ammoniphilus resinae]
MKLLDTFWKGDRKRNTLLDDINDFYQKNNRMVYAYFLKVTGSQEESEELTQETFYQAVKSVHQFKQQSSLKTWLLQIARNVYRNNVRSWARDQKLFSVSEDIEMHGDDTHNPLRISLHNQSKNEIRSIFQKLPDDYRDVLIFKEIEGLTHEEISRILGKTPQSTKVLLYRAKQKFKQLYEKEVVRYEDTI